VRKSAVAAPHPMAEHGFVAMYDPIRGPVERADAADMIERLPAIDRRQVRP